jgi:hypothetical protein
MLRSLFCVALLAVLSVSGADAFYGSGSDVISLTANNFDSKIKSGGVWLVEVRHGTRTPCCAFCILL